MTSEAADSLRAIAFYLPQFHPIPENDLWWGKGFTEWTNVRKAEPEFPGHYQPHVPGELGYYDLRDPSVRSIQADMAHEYGIYGFCYYHYWFNGKRLLETPFNEVIRTGAPDFPFCLCWANENWTRRWDGKDQLILMHQDYNDEDDLRHIKSLLHIFEDRRYIRINDKPLFLVYRTENMPSPAKSAEIWRTEARKAGIGEIYLARVESLGQSNIDPRTLNFDAAVEFAPDWKNRGSVISPAHEEIHVKLSQYDIEPDVFRNNLVSYYGELVELMMKKPAPNYAWFRCVTPSWDNSARRKKGANIFFGSTPQKYQKWLEKVIKFTEENLMLEEKIVFINAWNEWAEGNHIEPDNKFGKAYLEATSNALLGRPQGRTVEANGDLNWLLECSYLQRLVNLQAELDSVYKSRSWKVTSPLRDFSHYMQLLNKNRKNN